MSIHIPDEPKWKVQARPRRTFLLMPVIDRYIFKEFLIIFTVCIMTFLVLFLIADLLNDLQDFLDNKVSLRGTVEYFLLRMPANIRFILPISLLLSSIYVMARLGKNNEITAMRASGISLIRCGVSIYIMGLIATGFNFWFNERLVPECDRKSTVIRDSLGKEDYQSNMYKMLAYRSPDGSRTWLFEYFDAKGVHKNIKLKKHDHERRLEWDIAAEEAEHLAAGGWLFRRAVVTYYDKDSFLPKGSEKVDELMKSEEELPDSPVDIANAVKTIDELSTFEITDLLSRTKDMADSCRRVYESTMYSRLAFPWVCLLSVFLAIPLAGRNERRGIMISIIVAICIIIFYTIFSQIFLILGKRGIVPPFVAGTGATFGLVAYIWWTVFRHHY